MDDLNFNSLYLCEQIKEYDRFMVINCNQTSLFMVAINFSG